MLYAQVVLGLAVSGPFDYCVPQALSKRIKRGMRVWVPLRTQRLVGYVVNLTLRTKIKEVKDIIDIIDESPVLDKNMLLLTRELAHYYGCTWGEAIEAALPQDLRKGKKIPNIAENKIIPPKLSQDRVLIHDLEGKARWDIYLESIKEALHNHRSAILLLPDINSVLKAGKIITSALGTVPIILYRKQPGELGEWLKVRRGEFKIIIGTRSAIFAPVNNPGLVIIDEEEDSAYKQDQVPHYHARQVAFMRTKIEKVRLVLGAALPSLESFSLAKKGKLKYTFLRRSGDFPQVKIIDMRRGGFNRKGKEAILSRPLEDAISQTLEAAGKILLFLNRRGFATFASCRSCAKVLKCPRCNINLVYHFKEDVLNCHYCNFKMPAPTICPDCNSGYIRYLGQGTEKIESELSRLFPQARVKRLDKPKDLDIEDADIFIATSAIIKETGHKFELIGVLSIDNSLNRLDFRATEKTCVLLTRLLGLTDKKALIQTRLPRHYCFRAIENKDINIFYREELRQRREFAFPPYRHLCLVKLRGKKENRVREISEALFNRLHKCARQNKSVEVVSVNPGQPAKLRGNFYWQILLKARSPEKTVDFLKLYLKNLLHSGIIITIDMDPL